MPKKTATLTEGPIYSEKKIAQLTQYFRERVAEHMRLQRAGKLPYCKKIPIVRIEIRHIMEIMKRSRSTAHRLMIEIRKKQNKKPGEYVSVDDFCAATGLPKFEVQQALDLLT